MSDYEKINRKVAEHKIALRKEAFQRLIYLLAMVLTVAAIFVGLYCISFINKPFMVILISLAVCIGAFKAGWICRDIKF